MEIKKKMFLVALTLTLLTACQKENEEPLILEFLAGDEYPWLPWNSSDLYFEAEDSDGIIVEWNVYLNNNLIYSEEYDHAKLWGNFTIPKELWTKNNPNLRVEVIDNDGGIGNASGEINAGDEYDIEPFAFFDIIINGGTSQNSEFEENSQGALTWKWNFGDGGSSTLKNPKHKYSTSGTYSVKLTVTNNIGSDERSKSITINGGVGSSGTGQVVDIEGNVYNTRKINNLWWMVENLKVKHFNNGATIYQVANSTDWGNLTESAFSYANNNSVNKNYYGLLYNGYAFKTNKLCPTGWRVATSSDWMNLINYAGGTSVAAERLKEAGTTFWASPNQATNETGFSARPGGGRGINGSFGNDISVYANWYVSGSQYLTMTNNTKITFFTNVSNRPDNYGLYCRCVKN